MLSEIVKESQPTRVLMLGCSYGCGMLHVMNMTSANDDVAIHVVDDDLHNVALLNRLARLVKRKVSSVTSVASVAAAAAAAAAVAAAAAAVAAAAVAAAAGFADVICVINIPVICRAPPPPPISLICCVLSYLNIHKATENGK